MKIVAVNVRRRGDAYLARAGSGVAKTTASSTSAAQYAARRAAAKYFGYINPTSEQERMISLTGGDLQNGESFIATYARTEGEIPPGNTKARIVDTLLWHYVADQLPDDDITILIAFENPDTDEICVGYHEDSKWHSQEGGVITDPVYAWAYAPVAPPKKKATP